MQEKYIEICYFKLWLGFSALPNLLPYCSFLWKYSYLTFELIIYLELLNFIIFNICN